MAETSKTEEESSFKMGIGIWLSFCIFVCIWLLSRFVRGRRQLRNNLHVIEDGLKRLQDEIDRRQRENSITYGAGSDEINDLLRQLNKERATTEGDDQKIDETKRLLKSDGGTESSDITTGSEELLGQDKKND